MVVAARAGPQPVPYALHSGPNVTKDDAIRYWVHFLYTSDRRSLEMPLPYLHSRVLRKLTTWEVNRRQSEADDHGEAYSAARDGLNVYCTLKVPAGLFFLSLYDVNKDAREGGNDRRDYTVSIREHPAGRPLTDISGFEAQPELAHGRITDFWGGVYKRFLVRGPSELTIEVNRNHSKNTTLGAVLLDPVEEAPPPYFGTVEQWRARQAAQGQERQGMLAEEPSSAAHLARYRAGAAPAEAADRLLTEMERLRVVNPRWWAVNRRVVYGPLLRWYQQALAGQAAGADRTDLYRHLATCCYQMDLFPEFE